ALVVEEQGAAVEKMKVAQRCESGIARCIATAPVSQLEPGMKVMNVAQVGVGLTPLVAVTPMADEAMAAAVALRPRAVTPVLLETGIKPIDLLCPLTAGGSVGLFGIQGVGRIVL